MFYIVLAVLVVIIIHGPQLWVKFVLSKHSTEIADMSGTGGELAIHLLKRFEMEEVKVELSEPNHDYYSPDDNAVHLSPKVFEGKSLTAIAVAAHEVGHAIQFNRQEPVSQLRRRYLDKAFKIQRIGTGILMVSPVVMTIFYVPQALLISVLAGAATMLASVAMYAAILPEEWDASFNKALPILIDGEYVTEDQIKAVRSVLKACALTYVAAALADILSIWRWLIILRR